VHSPPAPAQDGSPADMGGAVRAAPVAHHCGVPPLVTSAQPTYELLQAS
jgi:hypothetical protein